MPTQEKITYPVRINRYLFLKGYCSRRKADRFIEEGLVKINGKKAELGDKVQQGDHVEVAKRVSDDAKKYIYVAYYKPRGIVSHNPQKGEKSIEDIATFPRSQTLSPLGRLDKESEGLMILSNDGRIVDRLLNPKYAHEKEYVVTVNKPINGMFLKKMASGVNIEGYITKPAKTSRVNPKTFTIILTEGKKHQIRRMCAALGYTVTKLKRTRIANITLKGLKPNTFRVLKGKERSDFLSPLTGKQ